MTLSEHQQIFASHTALLILYAEAIGYKVTYGDAFRDSRVHGVMGEKLSYSHEDSKHKQRLAVDLNLFRDGVYLGDTEDHEELGQFWESLDPHHNRWGGRWEDGNHYERNV